MSRSLLEYLRHVVDEARFLTRRSARLEKGAFLQDDTLMRAFVRSLEIIGEAVKQVPGDFRQKHKNVDWRSWAGMRDKLIHHYFGVDYEIVWDAIKRRIPKLQQDVERIIQLESAQDDLDPKLIDEVKGEPRAPWAEVKAKRARRRR